MEDIEEDHKTRMERLLLAKKGEIEQEFETYMKKSKKKDQVMAIKRGKAGKDNLKLKNFLNSLTRKNE